MGLIITAGPGRVGVLLGGAERALEEKLSWAFWAKAAPFENLPSDCAGVCARGVDTACLAGVASWRGGSGRVAPCAVFVRRETNKADKGRTCEAHVGVLQEHAREGAESGCMACSSPVCFFYGTVWRRRCELRHRLEVAVRGQCPLASRQRRGLLFRQLVAVQQTLELCESVFEVLCSRLAPDLVVQDTDSSLRSCLLVGSQGRRRRGRLGGGERNDI
jgi:hypothetical protein